MVKTSLRPYGDPQLNYVCNGYYEGTTRLSDTGRDQRTFFYLQFNVSKNSGY